MGRLYSTRGKTINAYEILISSERKAYLGNLGLDGLNSRGLE